jgi:hypothetical protein
MKHKLLRKSLVIGIIGVILLASFPLVMSSEVSTLKESPDEKPLNNDDIIFRVFGFKSFFVSVRNNKNTSITVWVNYTMKWKVGGTLLGANSTIYPFPVNANSFTFIFWDCQPMPFYYITITCEAAGQTFTRSGVTILGFNFFFR